MQKYNKRSIKYYNNDARICATMITPGRFRTGWPTGAVDEMDVPVVKRVSGTAGRSAASRCTDNYSRVTAVAPRRSTGPAHICASTAGERRGPHLRADRGLLHHLQPPPICASGLADNNCVFAEVRLIPDNFVKSLL